MRHFSTLTLAPFHTAHLKKTLAFKFELVFPTAAGLDLGGLAGWAVLHEDRVSSPPFHV